MTQTQQFHYFDLCYLRSLQQRKSTKSAECPGDDVTVGQVSETMSGRLLDFLRRHGPCSRTPNKGPEAADVSTARGDWNIITGTLLKMRAKSKQRTVFPKVPSLATNHVCIMQCRRAMISFDIVNQRLLCHEFCQDLCALKRKHGLPFNNLGGL